MIAFPFTCLYNVIVGSSASVHAACYAFLVGWAAQSETEKELSLRDASQSALMPSVLDRAINGEV